MEEKKCLEDLKVGDTIPDHLRPEGFLPKPPECKRCPKGYIIPEPTAQELLIKSQQKQISDQKEVIKNQEERVKHLEDSITQHNILLSQIVDKLNKNVI